MIERPNWIETWFSVVEEFRKRGSCPRLQTACAIVSPEQRLLSIGYNGSPPGHPTCLEEGCLMVDNHCLRTIHAEQNALFNAAAHGVPVRGATAYIAHRPCLRCATALVASGIKAILYAQDYTSHKNDEQYQYVSEVCKRSDVWLKHMPADRGLQV